MLFLKPVLFYDFAFPCSREGMEGVVGLQPSSAELLGSFSPLRLAFAQMPEWAGKAHLGPRNQEKPPVPSILVPLLLPLEVTYL